MFDGIVANSDEHNQSRRANDQRDDRKEQVYRFGT
jgi:hypothetical protein